MRGKKPKERQRYVLRVNETLIEVTRDVYLAWYQSRRKERYQLEKMQKNGVCGIEKVGETSYNSYLHILSPEEIVIRVSEIQELQEALKYLSEEEMELIKTMRPGLIQLEIGVQSTNGETVDAIHRHMDLDKLFHYVDRVHKLGNIHQHLDLIAGLPYEDYESFGKSFNDLYAHEPDQLQLGFLKVLKGTVMEEEVKKYDIIYRNQSPYEVLGTKWLSYDEIILLKGVEELVELYYNSGQYALTLKYAVPFFESPFRFYEMFSASYRKKGYHKLNHNRLEKYNILREFLRVHMQEVRWNILDEIMLYDMYLRENVKGRPVWAKDTAKYKKEWKMLYREQGEKLFPEEVQAGTYDSKKAANQSHIELFEIDIKQFEENGTIVEKRVCCLFDYNKRNPLNRAARTVEWNVSPKKGKI